MCPDCGPQPISAFGKNRSKADGLCTYCRKCFSARSRESYYGIRANAAAGPVKSCGSRACDRAGQLLPPGEFYRCAARADGLTSFCRVCHRRTTAKHRASPGRRRTARARQDGPITPTRAAILRLPIHPRIVESLRLNGEMTAKALRRYTRLSGDQVSEALPSLMLWTDGPNRVFSRNGTGPRVYFLDPERKQKKPEPLEPEPRSFGVSTIYQVGERIKESQK